jgi:hypothetical protein
MTEPGVDPAQTERYLLEKRDVSITKDLRLKCYVRIQQRGFS